MNDKYICTFFMPWEQKSERYKREEKNFAYDYRLCESKDFGRSLRIEPGEKQMCIRDSLLSKEKEVEEVRAIV